jgi:Protein of Unknown function (DUF2784)
MLRALDLFLSFLHIAFTLFNLVGWIWPRTRKAHLITIGATAASWFILGIWYGWGYCFLTDWQWKVKEKLGETNLPSSFIKYFADKLTGGDINPSLINTTTLVCFLAAVVLTIYVNFFTRKTRMTRMTRIKGLKGERKEF